MIKLSLFVLALAACAADPHITSLSGELRDQRAATTAVDVGVVWVNSSGTPDVSTSATAAVDVTGQFELTSLAPPAVAFMNDWYGVKVGVAYIVAGEPDSELAQGFIGIDENHLLVYVPEDVPAGSAAAQLLNNTPSAGFHVYGVDKTPDGDSFDNFVPLATDLATPLEIEVVDDPEQLDPPNWT